MLKSIISCGLPPTLLQNILLGKCLSPCDSACSNAVVHSSVLSVFIDLSCAEGVFELRMDFVSGYY